MKLPTLRVSRSLGTVALLAFSLMAFQQTAEAKGPKHYQSRHNDHNDGHGHDNDHDRVYYSSRPRSTFVLSFGTGYAGRGYYYGPPNSPYYYERSDVSYYATREAAPREYYSNHSYGYGSQVQRALARRGYYHGSIDGAIGPQSSRAIARYQRDHGLRQTGTINTSLLRSLDLQ